MDLHFCSGSLGWNRFCTQQKLQEDGSGGGRVRGGVQVKSADTQGLPLRSNTGNKQRHSVSLWLNVQ